MTTKTVTEAARELLAAMRLYYRAQAMEFSTETDALRAALAAEEGMVSVPKEPSSWLLAEMDKVQQRPTAGYWSRVYDAMIVAAEKERTS